MTCKMEGLAYMQIAIFTLGKGGRLEVFQWQIKGGSGLPLADVETNMMR
jgi:hypothetical protein